MAALRCLAATCRHRPFWIAFSIDSSLVDRPGRSTFLVNLPHPVDFCCTDGFFVALFEIEQFFVRAGGGLPVVLDSAPAAPLIPSQCFQQVCDFGACACVFRGGMSFVQSTDGRWVDDWSTSVAGVSARGRVVGTYSIQQIPEPFTLGLLGAGLAGLGWIRRRRSSSSVSA